MKITEIIDSIIAKVNTKAPLANPVLTGAPKAPTASVGTDTEQIATTEFVINELNKTEEW